MIICVCSPVVSVSSARHCSVNIVGDQPVEDIGVEEGDSRPLAHWDIIATCVEVSEHQDVLQAEGNSSNSLF